MPAPMRPNAAPMEAAMPAPSAMPTPMPANNAHHGAPAPVVRYRAAPRIAASASSRALARRRSSVVRSRCRAVAAFISSRSIQRS
jgi:hypothetical protein